MKKKITAIYPGTFDPVTNGHLDVIDRAAKLFDEVIVAVAVNINKAPLFTDEERMDMIKKCTGKYGNVKVEKFNRLLVHYAKEKKASVIVRGLRAVSDFEFEFQMSLTNRKLGPEVTTIYLMPNEKYTYLNSSLIRELSKFRGDISCFVPRYVEKKLKEKYTKRI
ncbi:MAG: pantetheine-phosphate adenylyltransferase [Ignavibacteria bacterium]|jgi:pantetheine-phosphate adenylyltransferase|nr:pantetheine-phosphate adenylyltransferase [Ignavibacteria bacterium]